MRVCFLLSHKAVYYNVFSLLTLPLTTEATPTTSHYIIKELEYVYFSLFCDFFLLDNPLQLSSTKTRLYLSPHLKKHSCKSG